MFAIAARQQLFTAQILESDIVAARQRMLAAENKLETFGEERPDVEPVPVAAEFGGNAEFGFAVLEVLADLAAVAAQEAEFEPVELPLDLVEIGDQQRQIDRVRQCDAERTDFATLEGGGQRSRAARRLEALLQQR